MGEDIEKMMSEEVIHDFKNILTGILGNLGIAKDWSKPEDQAYPFIEAAERVTKQANQLALQMLADARGGERKHFDFGLSKIVRDSVDLMIGGSHCSPRVQIQKELKMVRGDETRIRQVINNLLVNAKQAMSSGGVVSISASNITITEDSEYQLDPGEYVKVCIEDQGVGIPEENLLKIFEMHYTTKKEGSGIGLASCIHITKEHGGSIHVASEVGQGSTFSILLPALEKIDSDAILKTDERVEGSGTILVMDDEKMVQQIIGDMLGIFGYEVEFASNGDQAIQCYERALLKGTPPKLVIMDLTIPGGMGGVEAVKCLKDLDPNVRSVVSSGNPNEPAMRHCNEYGFIASIQKPYTLNDLQSMLANTIE